MMLTIPFIGDNFTNFLHVYRHHLHDFSDRLHFGITAYILAFFVLLTGAKQHFGNPIDCMLDKQIESVGSWNSYIHSYCLFYGTYRFTYNDTSYDFPRYAENSAVMYYQWIPFFLALQAFCFAFPHWLWTWLQRLMYLNLDYVVSRIHEPKDKLEKFDANVDSSIGYVYDHFKYRKLHKTGYFSFIFLHPAFACFLYFFTKILFILNDIIQLKLVCMFLGFNSWTWGFEMFMNFLSTGTLSSPKASFSSDFNHFNHFPIVVACDFKYAPSLSGLQDNTAQCVIPMNIINEKIFVALWLWYAMLTMFAIGSTISWAFKLIGKRSSEAMIYQLLQSSDFETSAKPLKHMLHGDYRYDFVHKFLAADGILMVTFMVDKCGILKSQDVVGALYSRFVKEHSAKQTIPSLTKRGEKADYSEVNFGADDDDDKLYGKQHQMARV